MGIQFSITVADDRIEIARGACIFALDRSTAVHQDYEAAAGMAVASGFGVASAFIVSLSPSHAAMATALVDAMAEPVMEETPLEAAIRRAEERAAQEEKTTDHQLYDQMMARIDRERLAGQARAQREQMGASQADAGSAVGVPQSYISRMERNDPSMSTKAAVTLAKRVISHYSAAANEKPLPTQFGKVLRAARKAKHLSSDQLGEQVGLARNYILKIERDPYRAAPRATVEKIAAFLGVLNVERFWKDAV